MNDYQIQKIISLGLNLKMSFEYLPSHNGFKILNKPRNLDCLILEFLLLDSGYNVMVVDWSKDELRHHWEIWGFIKFK